MCRPIFKTIDIIVEYPAHISYPAAFLTTKTTTCSSLCYISIGVNLTLVFYWCFPSNKAWPRAITANMPDWAILCRPICLISTSAFLWTLDALLNFPSKIGTFLAFQMCQRTYTITDLLLLPSNTLRSLILVICSQKDELLTSFKISTPSCCL